METTTPTMSTKQIHSKQQIRSNSRLNSSSSSKRWVGPSPDRRHQPPTVSTRRHRRHPTRMGSSIRAARICSTGMASRMVSQMPSTTTSISSIIMWAVMVAFRPPGLCHRMGTLDTLAIRSWPQVQQRPRPTRTIRSYEYPRRADGNTPRGRSVVAVASASATVAAKILGTDANFSEEHSRYITLRYVALLERAVVYVNFKSRRISLKKKNTIRVIRFLDGEKGANWEIASRRERKCVNWFYKHTKHVKGVRFAEVEWLEFAGGEVGRWIKKQSREYCQCAENWSDKFHYTNWL